MSFQNSKVVKYNVPGLKNSNVDALEKLAYSKDSELLRVVPIEELE